MTADEKKYEVAIPMKSTSLDLCKKVYGEILQLVEKNIANAQMAKSFDNCTDEKDATTKLRHIFAVEEARHLQPKVVAARGWLVIVALLVCVYEVSRHGSESSLNPFILLLAVTGLTAMSLRVSGSLPLESIGTGFFLSRHQARQADLDTKSTKSWLQTQRAIFGPTSFFSGVPLDDRSLENIEHMAMTKALFCLKNESFDCIAASAFVVLKLVESVFPFNIERVRKISGWDAHAFVVANRTEGNINDITTWNEDAVIVDVWYRICKTVQEIREDKNFFSKYPLLRLSDKTASPPFTGNNPPSACQTYLKKMQRILASKKEKTCDVGIVDAICPTLPRVR